MPDRYWQAKKVTLLGACINFFLGGIKILGGIFFHSHALFADGIHSFSDLLIDIMVLFASKYGSAVADENHPYGHQRIETAATLFLSLILILTGFAIAWDAMAEIINQQHTAPKILALPVAIISILANEILFHYTQHKGKLIRSDLLIANAWHHRSDAGASLVVLIGLTSSLLGYVYCDTIAAAIVGLLIIKMGWDYGWDSIKELVDTAIHPNLVNDIEQEILAVAGVKKVHQLRSRLMGKDIYIDVHILVPPLISVSEGHYIAQHVHQTLQDKFLDIKDVIVHVDPEDDEICCPSLHLPNRNYLEKNFLLVWQKKYPQINNWTIHYLDGKIHIDLYLDKQLSEEELNHLQNDIKNLPEISGVRLFKVFHVYGDN